MKLSHIKLQRVEYMPKRLEPGVLYVSEKFGAVAHLCACGCGEKIRTPLGPTEWTFMEKISGPSLRPSVGNWQKACKSHYIVDGGEIIWCDAWTAEQIMAGRRTEEVRRKTYYDAMYAKRGLLYRFWRWLRSLFDF